MRSNVPVTGLLFVGLACVACAPEVPSRLETSFSMAQSSFSFENYAQGFPESAIDAALMQRMFGPRVCQSQSPCVLKPRAQSWMSEANKSMTGGRCEGFAVLSSLFSSQTLNAQDFGGTSARSLELAGNSRLQRELAYWFSTQLSSEAIGSKTRTFFAKDVMPFLAQAFTANSKEQYRLGIVRKTGTRITGGHSLTPIGYYSGGSGVYFLRVYDSNNPDTERLLTIDTRKNRWEYEAARNPKGKSRLYFGDDSNKNPLYFAPIQTRVGTLPCKFCGDGAGATVQTRGGLQALITSAGKTVGVSDGTLQGTTTPTFTADLDSEESGFVSQVEDTGALSIALTGVDSQEASSQSVSAFGPNYVVSLDNLKIGANATDTLRVNSGATDVNYTSASKTALGLSTLVELSNGKTLEVTTNVGTSNSVGTRIDPMTGSIEVTTQGTGGSTVTVSVTQTNTDGTSQQGQLAFDGADAGTLSVATNTWTSDGGTLSGTVNNGGGNTTVTNACLDGVKSGMETDVDCGSVCDAKCLLGQACAAGPDCASGICHATTRRCVADACADGARNGAETDIDCGGASCSACANARACAADADCSSGACRGSVCVATFAIGVGVSGLPAGNTLTLANNGGDPLAVQGSGSYQFPLRVTGAYAVTIQEQPAQAVCSVVNGAGTANADVTNVAVNCVRVYFISGSIAGLNAGSSVVLQNNGADPITLVADGSFAFATPVPGAYAVTVRTQPVGGACTVQNGSGTATADVANVTVQCFNGYTIGGNVSGLPGGNTVTLANNAANTLMVTMNGPFSFPVPAVSYNVTVQTQPAAAFCSVSQGAGTATQNINNVAVACVPSGTLDPSYASGGVLRIQDNNFQGSWHRVVINPDDSMVWVGADQTTSIDADWIISKVQPNGELDTSFNDGGHLRLGRGVFVEEGAAGVWRDSQGRYQVAGSALLQSMDFAAVRVTATGSLDTSYGDGGWAEARIAASNEVAEDAVFFTNGSVIVVGHSGGSTAAQAQVVACKFTPGGALDTAWGTAGCVEFGTPNFQDYGRSAATDSTGNLYIVGHATTPVNADSDSMIIKLGPTGAPVTGFGDGGILLDDLSLSRRNDRLFGVVVDPMDRLLVVGNTSTATNDVGTVARYDQSGARDLTFGSQGIVTLGRPARNEVLRTVEVAPDGSLYAGGLVTNHAIVWKLGPNGAVNTNFGGGGFYENTFGGVSFFSDMAFQSTGKFVIGGSFGVINRDQGSARLIP